MSFFMALYRISRIIVNNFSDSRYPCFVPEKIENVFSVSTLSMVPFYFLINYNTVVQLGELK